MNKKELKIYFEVLYEFFKDKKGLVFCMLVNAAFIGIQPYAYVLLTGKLIDAVYAGAEREVLIHYALTGTCIIGLILLINGVTNVVFNRQMEYMFEVQNRALNQKSMQMDYEFLEDINVHNKRQNVNSNYTRFGILGIMLNRIWWFVQDFVAVITAIAIVIPVFFVPRSIEYGFVGSPWMSVLFVVWVAGLSYANFKVMNYFNSKIRSIKMKKGAFDNRKKYYMNLMMTANMQKDLIMCEQYGIVEDEMDSLIGQKQVLMKEEQRQQLAFMIILSIMSVLIAGSVYIFAGLRGYVGMITIGNVVTYAASITKITKAIYDLVNQIGWMKTETPYAIDFYNYMKLEKRKHEGCLPVEKRRDNKFNVEFDHVSFKYPGSEEYVIKDLSLSFVIGSKMAIIGKNGSGKTTFIKLLGRLYDVTEGCIKVNGIDIRKYDYNEYCDLFSAVFQDFTVFDFPLGEVLACDDNVDEVRAMDALQRAGLGERMNRLQDGLKTYIGKGYNENGVSFSGGELQKIAISRAIYKDAPFVIMDEPTAALDPEAEAEVFEGFDKMVGKKTAIYISHRLASCKFCEDILVFDQGKVVQHGTHEELETQEGLYKELWNAQAQYYA